MRACHQWAVETPRIVGHVCNAAAVESFEPAVAHDVDSGFALAKRLCPGCASQEVESIAIMWAGRAKLGEDRVEVSEVFVDRGGARHRLSSAALNWASVSTLMVSVAGPPVSWDHAGRVPQSPGGVLTVGSNTV